MRDFLRRYRIALAALAISAIVHAAVFVNVPGRVDPFADDDSGAPEYSATLDAVPAAGATGAPATPVAKTAARRVARARPKVQAIAIPDEIAPVVSDPLTPQMDEPVIEPVAKEESVAPADGNSRVALAQPLRAPPPPEPPKFPVDALPANVSIDYRLTSAVADGHARYSWKRDGDNYSISGEAEAQGFVAMFIEGRLRQDSWGKVTADGLHPEGFTERKPGNPIAEGIKFDWAAGKATLDKGDNNPKTVDISGNTVDWLSMIFQLAHTPPTGSTYDLRVFTQRRFYEFHLIVMGVEEIDIPMGKVRAQHLRHVDPQDGSVVDVWLGIDQHYLPVKLRYPVARNRLTVEQVATGISQ